MEELLSGLSYIIEVIAYLANPRPIFILEYETIVTFAKVSLGVLGGSILHAGFKKNPHLFGPVGAVCVAAVLAINFTSRITEEFTILLSLHYLNLTKVLDGLLFGIGLYRVIRFHKTKILTIIICLMILTASFLLFEPLREKITDIAFSVDLFRLSPRAFTLLVIALSASGMLGAYRRLPFLSENFLLTVSIIAVSITAVLIMPSLNDPVLPIIFLLLFPLSVVLGFKGGKNIYDDEVMKGRQ